MLGNDWTVSIKNIRESVGVNDQNAIEPRITVTYMVGAHGPFTKDFPKEGFEPMKAKAELAQFGTQLQQLAGY